MNKELQNLAWSVLPKEYREEVKKLYDRFLFTREGYYDELFGKHNLTSDAEGEEMLTVSRKQVQEMYADIINDIRDYNGENPEMVGTTDPILRERAAGMKAQLHRLFGSKCLPDDTKDDTKEPKPAEPRFKVGDTASYVCSPTLKHKCTVTKVMQNKHSGKWEYNVMYEWGKPGMWIAESDLEPYTELEKEFRNLSQNIANCDKEFDNILKDSFRGHNRLHVASMVLQGIMANPDEQMINMNVDDTLNLTLRMTDALLNECEEGGKS